MQRSNLPSKKDCEEILVKILKKHVEHEQHGEAIRRLGELIVDKDADRNFYAVLIRFFDPDNEIFWPNYTPPKQAKEDKETEKENILSLY